MAEQPYAIEMRGITKTFGSVVANKDVNLTLKKGEILALLGENGSGKTTLMNMLSGIRWLNLLKSNAATRGWLTVFLTDIEAQGVNGQPVAPLIVA